MADVLPIRPDLIPTPGPAASGVTPIVVQARQLGRLLSLGVRTVRTWDYAGKLPAPIRVGGKVVWRLDEIRNWVEAGCPDRVTWAAMRARRK